MPMASRARISTSEAWPPNPGVHSWWIRIFPFGSELRLPLAPPASRTAPIDIAIPTHIVRTSGLTNCIVS